MVRGGSEGCLATWLTEKQKDGGGGTQPKQWQSVVGFLVVMWWLLVRLVSELYNLLNQVNSVEVQDDVKLPDNFTHLVTEMKSNKYDAKEFAFILKGMVLCFQVPVIQKMKKSGLDLKKLRNKEHQKGLKAEDGDQEHEEMFEKVFKKVFVEKENMEEIVSNCISIFPNENRTWNWQRSLIFCFQVLFFEVPMCQKMKKTQVRVEETQKQWTAERVETEDGEMEENDQSS
ncbi:unnamed protein product [Lactuca virosa]|uniref:Uncharacterized protein n=1 Tax=Lactuca virosa TaxID=75947 RepID=A0AAU9PJ32_9ASTR|nr:unnamed protein product [Lactuca virosa]